MAVPDQDKVHSTLSSIESNLAEIPREALKGWLGSSEYTYSENHPRIRANIIWARMVHTAREKFREKANIRFFQHHNTVSISVKGMDHAVLFR